MILTCAGETISKAATADDVRRALSTQPHGDNWFIKLANGTDYLALKLEDDGELAAEFQERGKHYHARSAIDETLMKTLLVRYLARDAGWKTLCEWQAPPPPTVVSSLMTSVFGPPETRKKPDAPMPVLIAATGIGILLTVLPWIPDRFLPLWLLPSFMRDAGAVPVMLIFLAMPTLIIVGLVAKLLEARKASTWPTAVGRVVTSAAEVRESRDIDGNSTSETVPSVVYAFTVGDYTYHGTRIGIGEDTGGANTKATLARYPTGATVTVHYDPKNPKDCVLEYGGPQGLGKGCGTTIVSATVIGVAGYLIYQNFGRLEAALPTGAHAKLMFFAGLFGLISLGAFFRARRNTPKAAGNGTLLVAALIAFAVAAYASGFFL